MGTCYSKRVPGGKDPYIVSPSDMPHPTTDSTTTANTAAPPSGHAPAPPPHGFQKPYGGRYGVYNRNSNEQPYCENDRAALVDITGKPRNTAVIAQKPKNETHHSSKFGFLKPNKHKGSSSSNKHSSKHDRASKKRSDSNSNVMTNSVESMNSGTSSGSANRSKSDSAESLKRKQVRVPNLNDSFDPNDSDDTWLMIDAESQAGSSLGRKSKGQSIGDRTSSTAGSPARRIMPDDIHNANVKQGDTIMDGGYIQQSSGIPNPSQRSSIPSAGSNYQDRKGGSKLPGMGKLPSRLRGPFSRFTNSKTNPKPNNGNNVVTAKGVAAENSGWVKATPATPDTTDSRSQSKSQKKNSGNSSIGGRFLKKGFLGRQKHNSNSDATNKSSHVYNDNEDEVFISNNQPDGAANVSNRTASQSSTPKKKKVPTATLR